MVARKTYILKLYVAGNTPNSMRALNTLKEILENEFKGVYALKVIDVLKQPQLAEEDKILATPTLAKILPPPVRRIIGDLSDREKVLIGLDLLFDELLESEYSSDTKKWCKHFIIKCKINIKWKINYFQLKINEG